MTIERKVELGIGEPPLYVLFGAEQPANGPRFGPPWVKLGEKIAKVHVISPSAGGEVRGYWLIRGQLHLAHPLSPVEWPELDAEVTRATGLSVVGERDRCIHDENADSQCSARRDEGRLYCTQHAKEADAEAALESERKAEAARKEAE